MRKLGFIAGIVLVAEILVAAGFWLGFGQRFFVNAYSVTAMDQTLVNASERSVILEYLDSKRIDDARKFLRSQLDGDILMIWSLGDYSDDRTRKSAINILSRIADYRVDHPAFYTNTSAEVDVKIAEILEQARKAATNK